ncbi:hypothetical protein A2U01_0102622 [Trifolium medium]|uniref:Uncharacterized protein n=1 Tax=Trifolium medium TaxID=97028 RepID=A0A392V284_9FABA|nr:hypothetical protein [Trifolium medium]
MSGFGRINIFIEFERKLDEEFLVVPKRIRMVELLMAVSTKL